MGTANLNPVGDNAVAWTPSTGTDNYACVDDAALLPARCLDAPNSGLVTVAANAALNIATNITVEAWIYMVTPASNHSILYKGGVTWQEGDYSFGFYNGADAKLMVRLNGVDGQVTCDSALNAEQWYHVALTYDGSKIRIWVDGALAKEGEFSTPIGTDSNNMAVGANFYYAPGGFPGYLAEVRVSNTVRYTEAFTPDETLSADEYTAALYHFDDPDGDTCYDASANGLDGTVVTAIALVPRDVAYAYPGTTDKVSRAPDDPIVNDDYEIANPDLEGGVITRVRAILYAGGDSDFEVALYNGTSWSDPVALHPEEIYRWCVVEWSGLSINQTAANAMLLRLRGGGWFAGGPYVSRAYLAIEYGAGETPAFIPKVWIF